MFETMLTKTSCAALSPALRFLTISPPEARQSEVASTRPVKGGTVRLTEPEKPTTTGALQQVTAGRRAISFDWLTGILVSPATVTTIGTGSPEPTRFSL